MAHCLIISIEAATEVDSVIDCLRTRGVAVERWNLCQFPRHGVATIKAPGDQWKFGTRCRPAEFAAGWIHTWNHFGLSPDLEGVGYVAALRELESFLHGTLETLNCRWLNAPSAVKRASLKLWQLRVAERAGARVPDTIVSNAIEDIRAFAARHPQTVFKNIGTGYLQFGNRGLKFYTKRLAANMPTLDASLLHGPICVQEELPKAREIRVICIDDQCFSTELNCRDLPRDIVDVRVLDFSRERHRFAAAQNVSEVEKISRKIVEQLGLSYAGLDWIETPNGETVFLECNPLGSFLWYEITSGHRISEAIAGAITARALAVG